MFDEYVLINSYAPNGSKVEYKRNFLKDKFDAKILKIIKRYFYAVMLILHTMK